MNDIPPDLAAKRAVEDEALRLGAERHDLENKSAANIDAILRVLHEAEQVGVPFDHIAQHVGVSRQTLYRWRDVAARMKADAAEK